MSTSREESLVLPLGTTVRLNAHTYVFGGGQILMGGSPSRVARLTPQAAELFTQVQSSRRPKIPTKQHHRLLITGATSQRVAGYLVSAGMADPDPTSLPPLGTAEITVVIPCFRRVEALRRLLRSVTSELPDSSVIVVDDASGDLSPQIAAASRSYGAEVITCPRNEGPAAARDRGLARVVTPFVAFIDTDVVLRPGSMSLLLRHFADPLLAAAAPRVLGLAQKEPSWVLRYENARSSLDHGPDASLVRPHSPHSWLSTTCLLARTSAMGAGFVAEMRVAEDVDLVWRLVSDGWRVRYEPQSVVAHEHRSSVTTWLSRKYIYGTGAGILAQRHGALVAPAVMSPWAGVVLGALAAQRRWSFPVAGTATLIATVVNFRRLRKTTPGVSPRAVLALRLSVFGLTSALGQGLALTLRHWWPAAVAAACISQRARRLLLVAAVADAGWEYMRLKPRLDPFRFALARRLDDCAYGLGVWVGAWRARSIRSLLPTRPKRSRD
ncbi:mycofactocin biosynthesis glycosyltransferase MftF [Nesterenkonia haasae]|uniref:mycofactocin biosynthesis glycosyltransferase MftF n=1 Tax=Nesterenkonia haasae TaxID=2587813 RepID=UPI001391F5FE|nr:mycofactocin biosynthesis glycosyltransferase MftF [Nesterenkonia haasae]NDK30210.1 mycofactocin system glycosyltransferase [Nesterenkonia haasae]